MKSQLIKVADDFWNLRGSFRIAGLVDIGTHISLVKCSNGKFVFLDSYTVSDQQAEEIEAITGGSKNIEAILNLHPFHTVHVRAMHQRYPKAKLYGTARHRHKHDDLPWQKLHCEDSKLHDKYADDLDFSIPRGVDFISANENVHFSSVLAYHRASKTIHSDDTLMFVRLPLPMRWLGIGDSLSWHPTLSQALEKRPGAAAEFRAWAEELIENWGDAQNLCAAHTAPLLARRNRGASIEERIRKALDKIRGKLDGHERRYG